MFEFLYVSLYHFSLLVLGRIIFQKSDRCCCCAKTGAMRENNVELRKHSSSEAGRTFLEKCRFSNILSLKTFRCARKNSTWTAKIPSLKADLPLSNFKASVLGPAVIFRECKWFLCGRDLFWSPIFTDYLVLITLPNFFHTHITTKCPCPFQRSPCGPSVQYWTPRSLLNAADTSDPPVWQPTSAVALQHHDFRASTREVGSTSEKGLVLGGSYC